MQPMIAIVDDEPSVRAVALNWLTNVFGEIMRIVAWPPDRYQFREWDQVAVAIVDLRMPIPGEEILRFLRDHYPDIFLIAWTAYPDRLENEPELADRIVSKLGLEELQAIVGGWKP